jgi:D-2-hydroxyacid dehydrogenase (NADP+)
MHILIYLTHPHVAAWGFQDRHKEQFCRHLPEISVVVCRNSKEFLAGLPTAEGVIVWFFKREWEKSAPRLKWIATPAAGKDWIDVEPGSDLPVLFGGFHGSMMAESVLGAALYFCKAFQRSRDLQKKRKWARIKVSQGITSLYHKRVTVLGFGRIGKAIGRAFKPFGCHLTGVKRQAIDPPDYFESGDRVVMAEQLMEVLPETDHLVMALPGGEETDGLFTREHFKKLPPHCIVYNVGRGNVYRETDIVHALREKHMAGAYLDLFIEELIPKINSKL